MRLGARQPKCLPSRRLLAHPKICTLFRRPRTEANRKGPEIYPNSRSAVVIGSWSQPGLLDVARSRITIKRQQKCPIHTKTVRVQTGVNRFRQPLARLRIRWARVRRPRTRAPVRTRPRPTDRLGGTQARMTRRNHKRIKKTILMTEARVDAVVKMPRKACIVAIRKHRRARDAAEALTAVGDPPACSNNGWFIRPTSDRLSPPAGKV